MVWKDERATLSYASLLSGRFERPHRYLLVPITTFHSRLFTWSEGQKSMECMYSSASRVLQRSVSNAAYCYTETES